MREQTEYHFYLSRIVFRDEVGFVTDWWRVTCKNEVSLIILFRHPIHPYRVEAAEECEYFCWRHYLKARSCAGGPCRAISSGDEMARHRGLAFFARRQQSRFQRDTKKWKAHGLGMLTPVAWLKLCRISLGESASKRKINVTLPLPPSLLGSSSKGWRKRTRSKLELEAEGEKGTYIVIVSSLVLVAVKIFCFCFRFLF